MNVIRGKIDSIQKQLIKEFSNRKVVIILLISVVISLFSLCLKKSSEFSGKGDKKIDVLSERIGFYELVMNYNGNYIHGSDFYVNYIAAKKYLNKEGNIWGEKGKWIDLDLNARYSYPPLHAAVLTPFTFVSFDRAYRYFTFMNLVLLFLSFLLLAKLTKYPVTVFVFLCMIFIFSSFFDFHIERGQTDIMSLFFFSLFLSFYFKEKKNIYLSAVFLAIAAAFKVLPIIMFLFFLFRKEYKLIAYSVFVGIIIVISTGMHYWYAYFTDAFFYYKDVIIADYLCIDFNCILFSFYKHFNLSKDIFYITKLFGLIILLGYVFIKVKYNNISKQYYLLEISILTLFINLILPWAFAYKLVALPLMFIFPFYLLEYEIKQFKLYLLLYSMLIIFIVPINIHYWPILNNFIDIRYKPILAFSTFCMLVLQILLYLQLIFKKLPKNVL